VALGVTIFRPSGPIRCAAWVASGEAATAYPRGVGRADNEAERAFLAVRLAAAVDSGSDRSSEG